MDAGDRPTPPDDVDEDLRAFLTALGDEDAETIRTVAEYVDDLASWAETRAEQGPDGPAATETGFGDSNGGDTPTDPPIPEGVPDDATVSVADIAGTEYYYYQWREGDKIRSKTVKR